MVRAIAKSARPDSDADKRQYDPGKVDLGEQIGVRDQARCAAIEGCREEVPGHQRGEDKQGIRRTVRRHADQAAEHDRKNDHRNKGLQQHPYDAHRRLLVSHCQVAPDEKKKQLDVFTDLTDLKVEQAPCGMD